MYDRFKEIVKLLAEQEKADREKSVISILYSGVKIRITEKKKGEAKSLSL